MVLCTMMSNFVLLLRDDPSGKFHTLNNVILYSAESGLVFTANLLKQNILLDLYSALTVA